jgi:hypothetical protein
MEKLVIHFFSVYYGFDYIDCGLYVVSSDFLVRF